MRQRLFSTLRGSVFALGVLVVAAGMVAPAYAEERHDWHGDRHGRHWRGDRDGDRGGVGIYVGPSYGYYGYGYYPPPPVVYPQPGFSINIPLDIR